LNALLIINPKAGRARGPAGLARVVRALEQTGLAVECVQAAEAASVAGALRADLVGRVPEDTRVVVAGGDGSIHAVLPAVMNTPFPLAILPLGSVNVLARELGIPRSLAAAAQVVAAGEVRAIDLGVADGQSSTGFGTPVPKQSRPFVLMAGVGFDAAVVHSLAPQTKNLIGSFAYVARGLAVLARYRPSRFRITADGETIETEAWLAVVANTPRYTYRWRLVPQAAMDDGWLDLCLFESRSSAAMLGQVAAALRNRHTTHPGMRQLRAGSFRFDCDPAVCVQLDGDAEGMTPLEVRVAPGALRVVVPAK